jgi:hypothetical protein
MATLPDFALRRPTHAPDRGTGEPSNQMDCGSRAALQLHHLDRSVARSQQVTRYRLCRRRSTRMRRAP